MTHPLGRILLTVAAFLGSALTASANIVINGDFEGGTTTNSYGENFPNSWQLGPPSPDTLTNVNVSSTVDPSTFLGPESGTDYLRFQSTANNGTRDCVYQDLNTIAGQSYTISFWVAITTDSSFTGANGNTSLNPIWDENVTNTLLTGVYVTPMAAFQYQQFTFTETATTNLTRIDFHAVDATGSVLVDNISVDLAGVPEPSSLVLLGSAAAIGLCGHRLNRARKQRLSAR
jgi:PEP-CTERM motif